MLGLAVTSHLYPRLEAERFGAGRLTKIRAQSVSGVSCRVVAERIGVPDRLRATAPSGIGQSAAALVETERVLASVIEAVIGACFLHFGYERTAAAVVEAFQPEIANALEHPVDFKSTLQERLARRSETVDQRNVRIAGFTKSRRRTRRAAGERAGKLAHSLSPAVNCYRCRGRCRGNDPCARPAG